MCFKRVLKRGHVLYFEKKYYNNDIIYNILKCLHAKAVGDI